jgi:hypothetical protein
MHYTISAGDGFIDVKTRGDAELATLDLMVRDIVAHPHWLPHKRVLVDHSDLNGDPLSTEQLRAHVHQNAAVRHQIGDARVAIVVSRTLEFGMVRMWEGLVASKWDAATGCFTVREQAIAWLWQKPNALRP